MNSLDTRFGGSKSQTVTGDPRGHSRPSISARWTTTANNEPEPPNVCVPAKESLCIDYPHRLLRPGRANLSCIVSRLQIDCRKKME